MGREVEYGVCVWWGTRPSVAAGKGAAASARGTTIPLTSTQAHSKGRRKYGRFKAPQIESDFMFPDALFSALSRDARLLPPGLSRRRLSRERGV